VQFALVLTKFVENWKLDDDLQPQVYLAFMSNDIDLHKCNS